MTKKIKYILGLGGGLVGSTLMASPAWAITSLSLNSDAVSGFSISSLGKFIGSLLSFMFLIAGVIVFAFLVLGGLQWIMSGGDKAKTQEARDRITAALVGLAIIAVAWAVMIVIQNFFGISISNFSTPLPY